jgi:hypothetical protein
VPAIDSLLAGYWQENQELLVDADARSAARLVIDRSDPRRWQVRQILGDPEANHDWSLRFELDLDASREANRLVLGLHGLDNG